MNKYLFKSMSYIFAVWSMALAVAGNIALANSSTVVTKIYTLDEAKKAAEDTLVFAENEGRVYKIVGSDSALVESLKLAQSNRADVELSLENDERITAVKVLPLTLADLAPPSDSDFQATDFSSYQPTVLNSMADAERLYNGLNKNLRNRSQCYQRAMVWSYEMYQNHSVKSMKVFLFFSRQYVREYSYKWWFHVAPYVMVGSEEVVLDWSFTESALRMKDWTDEFVKSKHECLIANSYSEYESLNHSTSRHCILRKVPMYVHAPADIEAVDSRGESRTYFRNSDIEHAYRAKNWW